jgi:hypothetical protein
MIEREFIPYDRALALKELGFDEECLGWYPNDNLPLSLNGAFIGKPSSVSYKLLALAPLYQQAFRWFREKYDIEVKPMIIVQGNDKYYNLSIIKPLNDSYTITNEYKRLNTYEEAELACIDKLIQLIKEAKEL